MVLLQRNEAGRYSLQPEHVFRERVKAVPTTFGRLVVLQTSSLHFVWLIALISTLGALSRLQGQFVPVLERMLKTQARWATHGRPPDSAWTVLEGTGLDIERACKDRRLPGIVAMLNRDAEDVQTTEIRGTPMSFVKGKPLRQFGAQELHDMVAAEVYGR